MPAQLWRLDSSGVEAPCQWVSRLDGVAGIRSWLRARNWAVQSIKPMPTGDQCDLAVGAALTAFLTWQ